MLVNLVEFAEYLLKRDLTRSTVRTYLAGLRVFARWWEPQGRSIRGLSADDVARFIAWRLETGGSPASVNRTLAALRHFCRWAKRRRHLSRDPMGQVVNLSVARPPQVLSSDALDLLLDVVRRDRARRDRAVLLLLLRGGLNPAEVTMLRVEDVVQGGEGDAPRVHLRRASEPGTLLLDQELTEALQGCVRARAGSPQGRLFCEPSTRDPLTVEAVEQMIASYGRAAGLNGLRWRTVSRSLTRSRKLDSPAPPDPLSLLALARRALNWPHASHAPALS